MKAVIDMTNSTESTDPREWSDSMDSMDLSGPPASSLASTTRVFRVTVRGQFADLTDEARRYLVAAQAEHDLFVSAYTSEGTFTYDQRIAFFNLRYEIRSDADGSSETAASQAMKEAELFLTTMRFGYKKLRPTVVDASAMWADVERRIHGR